MHIEQFDPLSDAARLRACFEITEAGWPIDHPSEPAWAFDSFVGKWARGFNTSPRQTWLGTDGYGNPVGCYLLTLPERENATIASCILTVAPAHRRAGLGSALLAHCATQARQAGRSRLAGNARDDSPGAAFASACGARGGIPEVNRMLDIDDALLARLVALRANAQLQAAEYSLLSWIGPTPEEYIEQVVRVTNAMADAPRDQGVEPAIWDAGRLRQTEQTMIEHGLTNYTVVAQHDASGDLAALTAICTEAATPDWGFQQQTAVLPEHRGHRLGLLLKIAMLELLTGNEPAVGHIITGNAGANAHMIAINDQLGFKVAHVYRQWEIDLTTRGQVAAP